MSENQTESKPTNAEEPTDEGLSSSVLFGILGPSVMAVITAAQAIRRDAEVYGLAGATNHPAVRCEVKGLCLKHWYDLCAALESLPNSDSQTKVAY